MITTAQLKALEDPDLLERPDRPTLGDLGELHRELRRYLAILESDEGPMHELMRRARRRGATLYEILDQTGYQSLMTVRRIVTPGVDEQVRKQDADRRARRIAADPARREGGEAS
jgi:hypothetical protein